MEHREETNGRRTTVADWWNRSCGARDVLRIALPLMISTASWALMNFVDRMFLLWHSPTAMAAAMPAGMLLFTLLCFPLGVASYVNTFVAQYHGAGQHGRIGSAIWQAVRIGWVSTPLFLATIPLAPWLFGMVGHDPAVASSEILYYQVLTFGAGAAVIAGALASFFTGRGQTRTVMVVDSTAAALNVVLDYAWIFGHWGFAAWGIEGAAWATVVSQWLKVIWYGWLVMRPKYRAKYQMIVGRRYDRALMRRLWRFGAPNGLQMLVEMTAVTMFILLLGRLGSEEMVATTLAFNVNAFAFVPMLGMGIAVSTIVGQQLGRGRPDRAARATWTAMTMAAVYTGAMALAYVTIPDVLLMGHAAGTSPAEFAQVRDTAVVLLRFVAAYCLFDAMNIVFVGAIKGAGDTRFVLIVTSIASPLPIIIGWVGIRYWDLGLIYCWWVITGWITVLGVIYFARFMQGQWRQMRVIEPDLLLDERVDAIEPSVACAGQGDSSSA